MESRLGVRDVLRALNADAEEALLVGIILLIPRGAAVGDTAPTDIGVRPPEDRNDAPTDRIPDVIVRSTATDGLGAVPGAASLGARGGTTILLTGTEVPVVRGVGGANGAPLCAILPTVPSVTSRVVLLLGVPLPRVVEIGGATVVRSGDVGGHVTAAVVPDAEIHGTARNAEAAMPRLPTAIRASATGEVGVDPFRALRLPRDALHVRGLVCA